MSVSQIISRYNLISDRRHTRSLGQNFLIDEDVLNRIASACVGHDKASLSGYDFIEIGPGPCGLTTALAQMVGDNTKIVCIEKDETLRNLHRDISKEYQQINFIYEDALSVDISDITDRDVVLFGNLPYNVGTKILMHFISKKNRIKRSVFMLQKEVVDRICAECNTKDYGYLSIMCQLLCDVRKLFDVDCSAFYPKPKVVSSVVELVPKPVDYDMINNVQYLVKACFENRRKTLFNVLRKILAKDLVESVVPHSLLKSRPEVLSPSDYLALAQKLID